MASAAVIFAAGCSSSSNEQDATAPTAGSGPPTGSEESTNRDFLANCPKTGGGGTVDSTFGGRAYALEADASLLGLPLVLPGQEVTIDPVSDTGMLPPEGGDLAENQLELEAPENPLIRLSASLLDASVIGGGDMTVAFAQTAELDVAVMDGAGGDVLAVNAGLLQAHSALRCDGNGETVQTDAHGANIFGLNITLLGEEIPIPAEAPPNTNLLEELPAELAPLISGKIVLNEQFVDDQGRHHVNALHIDITVLGVADDVPPVAEVKLIVSHAEAALSCGVDENGGVVCPCKVRDFITGGGYIDDRKSSTSSYFGLNGGERSDGRRGNLTIEDRRDGTPGRKVRSDTLIDYVKVDNSKRRLLTYNCTVGGKPDTCHVEVEDKGNPASYEAGVDDLVVMSEGGFDIRGEPIAEGSIFLHQPPNCPQPEESGNGNHKPHYH